MKPSESIPGITTLVDDRGLSPKARRAELIAQVVVGVNRVMEKRLANLHLILRSDPALVVSETYYDRLNDVLPKLLKNWQSMAAPFNEELLIRSATFDQLFDLRLATATVPFGTRPLEDVVKDIHKQIEVLEHPEQVIIHPRQEKAHIRDQMIALRGTSVPGDVRVECGLKGIEQVGDLNKAEFYQSVSINDLAFSTIYEPFIPFVRGVALCNSITDKLMAQLDTRVTTYRTPVYEYKCFQLETEGVMIMADYDLP